MAEPHCLVFWGSHGCGLPRGHPDAAERHQCGLDGEDWYCPVCEEPRPDGRDAQSTCPSCATDVPPENANNGPCSQVTWELDPLLGEERWVWRFANAAGDGWDDQAFPATLFGEDAPANRGTPEQEERVRRIWQDAGKLAHYVAGRGWVYEKAGAGDG